MISINVSNIDFGESAKVIITGGTSCSLQTKTVDITENGTTTVSPSANYDGLSSVVINVNVPNTGGGGSGIDFSIIGYNAELSNELNAKFNADVEYSKTLLDAWNPSNTSANDLYEGDTQLVYAPNIDTSNCAYMNNMFSGCTSLTTVPEFDTSNCTQMNNMFNGCTSLTTVPEFDTSNCTHMLLMFNNCTSLTTVPEFDTSNCTSMATMFGNCEKLTTVPEFDTSNCTSMSQLFSGCKSLTTVPPFNTSKVENFRYAFADCYELESLPLFDFSVVKSTSIEVFGISSTNFEKLTTLGGFKDLKYDWTGIYGLNRCPNLTYESVMNVINNLYDFRSNGDSSTTRTLKLNANSLALLTDDDKAIATSKGWVLS